MMSAAPVILFLPATYSIQIYFRPFAGRLRLSSTEQTIHTGLLDRSVHSAFRDVQPYAVVIQ